MSSSPAAGDLDVSSQRAEAEVDAPESAGLLAPEQEFAGPQPSARFGRRLLAGSLVFACAAAVVVVRKAFTPCAVAPAASPGAEQSIVTLVESGSEDLFHLMGQHTDSDAVAQWLEMSSAASEEAQAAPGGAALHEAAETAVQQAMAVEDKKEAKKIVDRAMGRALRKLRTRRQHLKAWLKAHPRGLRKPRTPGQKASVASCTFNTLEATNQLAALATSINDAARTCSNVKDGKTLNSWYGKVCSINIDQVIASVAGVASTLSLAANNCAESLVPNVNALCSGTITGLIQSLAEFAIGADLTASACQKKLTDEMPPKVTPSTIGQAGTPEVFDHRRLSEQNATAHPRRLMFGGGKGAVATFCYIDASSAAWYLAQAGLAINAAANPKTGATCPPRNKFGNEIIKGAGFRQSQGFCTVDISGAIYGFLQAIKYIQMAFVHCPDTWNFQALCGAGISGMLAQLDAVAYFGSAMWLSCDELLDPKTKLTSLSKQALANNALGNSGNLGRRLSVEDGVEGVAALQRKFDNPDEAWKSIGLDVSSPDSELRKVEVRKPPAEEIVELVQEDAPAPEREGIVGASTDGGLFNGPHFCS